MSEPPSSIKDIKIQTFSTYSQQQGDTLVVALSGNADMAVHDQLRAFLDELHRTAGAHSIREAVLEMQELYFMNSSCLSLLLRLVNSLLKSKPPAYTIRFRSNPNLRWQKKSLDAIRAYAGTDVVVVE
jgi:anti-anti-sigma factor